MRCTSARFPTARPSLTGSPGPRPGGGVAVRGLGLVEPPEALVHVADAVERLAGAGSSPRSSERTSWASASSYRPSLSSARPRSRPAWDRPEGRPCSTAAVCTATASFQRPAESRYGASRAERSVTGSASSCSAASADVATSRARCASSHATAASAVRPGCASPAPPPAAVPAAVPVSVLVPTPGPAASWWGDVACTAGRASSSRRAASRPTADARAENGSSVRARSAARVRTASGTTTSPRGPAATRCQRPRAASASRLSLVETPRSTGTSAASSGTGTRASRRRARAWSAGRRRCTAASAGWRAGPGRSSTRRTWSASDQPGRARTSSAICASAAGSPPDARTRRAVAAGSAAVRSWPTRAASSARASSAPRGARVVAASRAARRRGAPPPPRAR